MKELLYSALLFTISGSALGQTAASDQLEDFVGRYQAAWQAHDGSRLAEFFTADADMVMGILPRIDGQAAIETWWNAYFSHIDSGRSLAISIESLRVLTPDVALLNVGTTTAGTDAESGAVLEPRKARGTWVVVRRNGDWKIAALRAHSPVGEMRSRPGTDD